MKTFLKIAFVLVLLGIFSTIFFFPVSNKTTEAETAHKIVTTIFPAYDFARTISKDTNSEVKLLLKPGTDIHSFEPSPQDIIAIKEADIFIYNGGESEQWVDDIISEIDQENTVIVRMMDAVEPKEEPTNNILDTAHENSEPTEYDEHIWTSPKNVIKISENIAQAIKNYSPDDSAIIQRNLDEFKANLEALDANFRNLATKRTGTIIVADRFPFRYFIDEYGFDYLAALPGCSEQTEASAKTITTLINRSKQSSEKVIFTIELSNSNIAKTIAKATKAKILIWHSVHNVTQADFDAQKTYLDYMRENLQNLSEALHDRAAS